MIHLKDINNIKKASNFFYNTYANCPGQIDNSTYRLISDLGKSRHRKRNSRKEPFKSSKISKFGREIL